MKTSLTMTGRSDMGRVREQNQDCVHTDAELPLFVLADGVGGMAGGGIASELAVRTIVRGLRQHTRRPWFRSGRQAARPTLESLNDALLQAHQALLERARSKPGLKGMSCTVVAGSVDEDHCLCVAVGDSRLYRLRGGRLTQITRDQTLANKLLRDGFIEADDERMERFSHVLTAALGSDADPPEIQQYRIDLEQDDVLLACSDGLSNMLPDEQIAAVINNIVALDESADQLVTQANDAGGRDNISLILVAPKGRSNQPWIQRGIHDAISPPDQG